MHWIGLSLVALVAATHTLGHEERKDMDMDMDMGNKSDHDMDMAMYFRFRTKETVLFKGWKISNAGGMAGSMIGILLMSFLYEGLKFYREHLFRKERTEIQSSKIPESVSQQVLSAAHGLQTFLHVLQIVLSYFLMLIFMTYNGYLCIALLLGSATGYFAFGWKRALLSEITEHCL